MTINRRSRARALMQASPPLVASALFLLLLIGNAGAAQGASAEFWRGAAVVLAALGGVGLLAWWAVFRPQANTSLLEASPATRQMIAYLATLFGLLLLAVILWSQVKFVTQPGLPGLAGRLPDLLSEAVGTVLMLTAAALQMSLLPRSSTWNTRRLDLRELNLILLLAVAAFLLLPGGGDRWVIATSVQDSSFGAIAQALAPPGGQMIWLYPAAIGGTVLLIGQVGLQALRRPGVAVMIFAAVLFLRAVTNFIFAQRFDLLGNGALAEFLALAPAATLDAVYMMRLPEADARNTFWLALGSGVAVMGGGALLVLPAVSGEGFDIASALAMIGATAAAGLWCGWCGDRYGRWISRIRHRPKSR